MLKKIPWAGEADMSSSSADFTKKKPECSDYISYAFPVESSKSINCGAFQTEIIKVGYGTRFQRLINCHPCVRHAVEILSRETRSGALENFGGTGSGAGAFGRNVSLKRANLQRESIWRASHLRYF